MTENARLAAYLDRLGLGAPPRPDPEGLAGIQAAHRQAIAFENLDVRLNRAIRIGSDEAFDKLIVRGRGGYCFEQNRVFSDMLAALAIPNRPLLARVRLGVAPDVTPPRTHVLLLADLADKPWVADAGFGGSYVPPLLLSDGATARSDDGAHYRLRRIGAPGDLSGEWLLERAGPVSATDGRAAPHDGWQAQYAFDLIPVAPDDLEQCNHWTSTRPGTRFTTLQIVSIVLPDGFAAMTDRKLTMYRGGDTKTQLLDDPEEYLATLRDLFRISLDADEKAALRLAWRELA